MPDRFFYSGAWSDVIELTGEEAHHLARVLRAQPGDQIELFDGQGSSAPAEVVNVHKQHVTARLLSSPIKQPESTTKIVLAVASPKGDRLRWLIEKVTELGIDRFILLQTQRGVVHPGDQKLNKLALTALSACKQSGRNVLLDLEESCPLADLLGRDEFQNAHLLYGSRTGETTVTIDSQIAWNGSPILCFIGPEGGFTRAEEAVLQQHRARPVSVSPQILRVETAALALSAWLCSRRMARNS
jgi:16S rRNA (uracil1498-N3)-methyltransferase